MSNDLREIYIKLLYRVRTNGINFQLRGRLPNEAALNGLFYLHLKLGPMIDLFRDLAPDQGELTDSGIAQIVDDAGSGIEHEIVTLAHEYGHYESWQMRHRSAEYVVVADRFRDGDTLDSGASRLIWEEEALAWNYAKALLNELLYQNQVYLQRRTAEAEIQYQRRLPNLDKPPIPSAF